MKKIIIMLFLTIIITTTAKAFIQVTKQGGGKHGYSLVSEVHRGNEHYLNCSGSGYSSCVWTVKPSFVGPNSSTNGDDLEQYANEQIDLGNYSGSYINNIEINGDLWNRSVQWSAQDSLNANIEISVELSMYPN